MCARASAPRSVLQGKSLALRNALAVEGLEACVGVLGDEAHADASVGAGLSVILYVESTCLTPVPARSTSQHACAAAPVIRLSTRAMQPPSSA